jgi:hypothetical protein
MSRVYTDIALRLIAYQQFRYLFAIHLAKVASPLGSSGAAHNVSAPCVYIDASGG